MNAIVPVPRCEMTIRAAMAGDIPFIDGLQKKHHKMVGFFQRAALEEKIAAGDVLIAEHVTGHSSLVTGQGEEPSLTSGKGPVTSDRVGYVIAQDRYLKREELGVIYQLNVMPGAQRKLIGATLIKAVFDRAAYGCKLFCLWCAQDIEANYFWESLGFIPLAFRAGSRGKERTHIFWQKRIREGDVTTPYWFPAKTDGGMVREDRLVLPIPPGVHWKSEMPVLLPTAGALPGKSGSLLLPEPPNQSPPRRQRAPRAGEAKPQKARRLTLSVTQLRFIDPDAPAASVSKPKARRAMRPKAKADPVHVAAARELRDRYLEQFNTGLVLPSGKYQVSRALPEPAIANRKPVLSEANGLEIANPKSLPAAA